MVNITTITQLAVPFSPTPSINNTLYFYGYGYDTINTNLNFVSGGYDTINNSLDLVSSGLVVLTGGINLSAYGAYSNTNNNLPFISEGFTSTPNASLDFYAYVSDIGTNENGVNLFAKVAEGASLDMIAFGPAFSQDNSIFFSADGVNSINNTLNFVTGSNSDVKFDSITFHSIGW